MASISGNIVMTGLSGMLDKQLVFYRRGEKQFVRKAPAARSGSSRLQVSRQERFKDAVVYAKTLMADPATIEMQTGNLKPGQRLFNWLVSEYMKRDQS